MFYVYVKHYSMYIYKYMQCKCPAKTECSALPCSVGVIQPSQLSCLSSSVGRTLSRTQSALPCPAPYESSASHYINRVSKCLLVHNHLQNFQAFGSMPENAKVMPHHSMCTSLQHSTDIWRA